MHRYLIFDLEMRAVRRFLYEAAKLKESFVTADQVFFRFMETQFPSDYWPHFQFLKEPTKKEKAQYLMALGIQKTKIWKTLYLAPNTLWDLAENPLHYRYYQDNDALDALIEQWKPYRELIPNEFFLRYLSK